MYKLIGDLLLGLIALPLFAIQVVGMIGGFVEMLSYFSDWTKF